jgi:GT2 family glycosyltransferase
MVQALKDNPKIGIIGPSMGGEYAKHFSDYILAEDEVREWGTAIGACMVCRNIGLRWSEDFLSGYWADTDFGRQYKEKGYKICLHGGAKIDHEVHTTLGASQYVNDMMEDGEMVYWTKWGDNFV